MASRLTCGGLLEEAVGSIEDVKEQLLAGDYTVEEVVDSAKNINASELPDQQMKRLKDCMEKESEQVEGGHCFKPASSG